MRKVLLALVPLLSICILTVNGSAAAAKKRVKSEETSQSSERFGDDIFTLMPHMFAIGQKTKWTLAFKYKKDEYAPVRSVDLMKDLLEKHYNKEKGTWKGREYKAVFGILSDLDEKYYLVSEKDGNLGYPYQTFTFEKNNTIAFFTVGSFSMNTRKLSSKEMATKNLADTIVPNLHKYYKNLKDTDVKQLAIFMTYGVRDFAEEPDSSEAGADTLGFFVKMSDLKNFITDKITDQDLVDKSKVLLSSGESNEFNRIKVVLK